MARSTINSLPSVGIQRVDGGLRPEAPARTDSIVLIGTADKGVGHRLSALPNIDSVASTLGRTGSLPRAAAEVFAQGANNVFYYRIGSTAAVLSGVNGFTIRTLVEGDEAGSAYSIFHDASEGRLVVFRAADSEIIFDTDDTSITNEEVLITGTAGSGTTDVGTLAAPVLLKDVSLAGSTFVAGSDGLALSQMRIYEEIENALVTLETSDVRIVVCPDALLDAPNTHDLTTSQVGALSISGFPTAGTSNDVLCKAYVEEFRGVRYHFWDTDNDGVADIVPTVDGLNNTQQTALNAGNISIAQVLAGGSADLTSADFSYVNFAWMIGMSLYDHEIMGFPRLAFVGVRLPNTPFAHRPNIEDWLGRAPIVALNGSNQRVITTNGTGLRGNRFLAGRVTASTIPGNSIGGLDGAAGGGFIATAEGTLNGTQLRDAKDNLVDLGKFLCIVANFSRKVSPAISATAYVSNDAAVYAGFVSARAPQAKVANERIANVVPVVEFVRSRVDSLCSKVVLFLRDETGALSVANDPLATRRQVGSGEVQTAFHSDTGSDYQSIIDARTIQRLLENIRLALAPILKVAGTTESSINAMNTKLKVVLTQAQSQSQALITSGRGEVTLADLSSRSGRVQVSLAVVPLFQINRIDVNLALALA